ncbi:MAG: single-stranded DNA-binding protein, partial [Oscillospiraceae bacterium]
QTAEFVCKYFHKGSLIALDGSIQTRNYEDKSGNKRTAFEIVANNVHFAGAKSDNVAQAVQTRSFEPVQGTLKQEIINSFTQVETDGDLPF